MTNRETDGDDAERFFQGQQAFWRGEPRTVGTLAFWRDGWDAAALEAQRTIVTYGDLITGFDTIRDALSEADGCAKHVLTHLTKIPPGLKMRLRTLRGAIETLGDLERLGRGVPSCNVGGQGSLAPSDVTATGHS